MCMPTCSLTIVLNLASTRASLQYYLASPTTQLPYVCEIDVGVRFASTVPDPTFGLVCAANVWEPVSCVLPLQGGCVQR